MPHFIIECSEEVIKVKAVETILKEVFDTAVASGLFNRNDIKVRLRSYEQYITGGDAKNFIHVFAYIMEGRSAAQKGALSEAIVRKLTALFPDVPFVSMNISEFELSDYRNRKMI